MQRWQLASLGVIVVCVVGVVGLLAFSRGQPEQAQQSANTCLNRAEAGSEEDPVACVRRANQLFAPALPGMKTEQADTEAMQENLQRAAVIVLEKSSAMFPDAERLREAVKILEGGEHHALIESAGASQEASRPCGGGTMGGVESSCFYTERRRLVHAFQRGDRQRALSIGPWLQQLRSSSTGSLSYGCDLQLAALLCLLGDSATGRAIFERDSCGDNWKAAPGRDVARRLGALACGAKKTSGFTNPDFDTNAKLFQLIRDERADVVIDYGDDDNPSRLPFAAAAMLRDPPDATGAVRHILGGTRLSRLLEIHHAFKQPLSRPELPHWEQFATARSLYFVPADMLRRAAELLDGFADDPELTLDEASLPPEVTQDPQRFFRKVAWIMRLYAATEELRRHHVAEAKRILAHPAPLPGPWGLVRTHLLLEAGGISEVLKLASEYAESDDAVERTLAESYRALALIATGKDREAFTAVQAALKHAPEGPGSWWLGGQTLATQATKSRLAWLRAALAHRLGDPLSGVPFIDPEKSHGDQSGVGLGRWWEALRAGADERRHMRPTLRLLQLYTKDYVFVGRFCDDVTPMQMYLVGEVARGDGDIEVWLDRVFSDVMRDGRCALRARANAARWRGDTAAATLWEERAIAHDKLIADENTALLTSLAEL